MIRIGLFLLFETLVLLASRRIVKLLSGPNKLEKHHSAEQWLAALLIAFVIQGSFALIFSSFGLNSLPAYLLSGLFLFMALYRFDWRIALADMRDISQSMNRLDAKSRLIVFLLALMIAPVLIGGIRPVEETDSLFHLTYMSRWLSNISSPYGDFVSYPAFWELTYLPSLSIISGDHFLWWNSLKAIVVILLAQYALCKRLGLAPLPSLIAAFSGVMLSFFWVGNSGIATIKNDMIVAGGFLTVALAALAILKNESNRLSAVLLSLGITMMATKFTGIILGPVGIALLFLFAAIKMIRNWKGVIGWTCATVILCAVTSGIYYYRNYVAHDNPFWPVSINALGHCIFPGAMDLSGTSILDHVDEPEFWLGIFKHSHVGGPLLFPIMGVGFVAGLVSTLIYLYRRLNPQRIASPSIDLMYVSWFACVGWLLYLRSPWSAGAGKDDLFYITDLASLRYASGPLMLSEIIAFCACRRLGLRGAWVLLLPAILLGGRLQHLLEDHLANRRVDLVVLLMGEFAILVFITFLIAARKKFVRNTAAAAFVVLLFFASPYVFEQNHANWFPCWKPTWMSLRHKPAMTIGLMGCNNPHGPKGCWSPWLAVCGAHLQHTIVYIDESLTDPRIETLDCLVRLQNPNYLDEQPTFELAERVMRMGFCPEVASGYSMLAWNTHVFENDTPGAHGHVDLPFLMETARQKTADHKPREVIDILDRWIETCPMASAEVHYLYAYNLHQLGDTRALEHYNKALSLGFSPFWTYYNRGHYYLQQGNRDAAIDDLERAQKLKPDRTDLRTLIAELKHGNETR